MQSEQDFAGTASTYFTVDGLPVHERYGIWKDAIQSIFSVDAEKQIREDDFRTTIESHLFGSLMLMEVHTRAQQWGRGYEQIAGNGMDHYGIGLYQEGTVYCEGAKGGKVLKPGGLMIYDLTQPFTAETSDLKNLNLVIPRSLVEDLLHQPDEHCMRFLEPSDPMVQIIRDMIISLHRNVVSLNYQQSLVLEKTIPMLLANCLNSISGQTRETSHERQNILSMVRMRRYFRENLGSPELNPRQAAQDLGVSRSKLYTCFAPYGGVYNYVRDLRLRRAITLLNDPLHARSSIYDIALECGFSSDASFIRAFREKYDVTPGEVRNGAAVHGRKYFGTGGPADKLFENWIHGLT
ncbi:MAG: AraC family transcriptional regulator [Thalassospira sp.]|uniref:AraC family transcriptional regulator n=1 Tax=Thalassospira sp. TaxID=1912094 RepID=UPI0032F09936